MLNTYTYDPPYIPGWRHELSPAEVVSRYLYPSLLLGFWDGRSHHTPHDEDRFGEDRAGRRLYDAYLAAYRGAQAGDTLRGVVLRAMGDAAPLDLPPHPLDAPPPQMDMEEPPPRPGSVSRTVWRVLRNEPELRRWSWAVIAARVETITGQAPSKPTISKVCSRYLDGRPVTLYPDEDGWVVERGGNGAVEDYVRECLTRNPHLSGWSSREVARRLGVETAHKVVDAVRGELVESGQLFEPESRQYQVGTTVRTRNFDEAMTA